jgi:hypothetical protein
MSEYASCFGLAGSLNLQHLTALQAHEARMGKIKWYGKSKDPIRGEELLRQPNMGQRDDVARLEFAMQTPDPPSHQGAFQLQRQVAKARRQQRLIVGVRKYKWPACRPVRTHVRSPYFNGCNAA